MVSDGKDLCVQRREQLVVRTLELEAPCRGDDGEGQVDASLSLHTGPSVDLLSASSTWQFGQLDFTIERAALPRMHKTPAGTRSRGPTATFAHPCPPSNANRTTCGSGYGRRPSTQSITHGRRKTGLCTVRMKKKCNVLDCSPPGGLPGFGGRLLPVRLLFAPRWTETMAGISALAWP